MWYFLFLALIFIIAINIYKKRTLMVFSCSLLLFLLSFIYIFKTDNVYITNVAMQMFGNRAYTLFKDTIVEDASKVIFHFTCLLINFEFLYIYSILFKCLAKRCKAIVLIAHKLVYIAKVNIKEKVELTFKRFVNLKINRCFCTYIE